MHVCVGVYGWVGVGGGGPEAVFVAELPVVWYRFCPNICKGFHSSQGEFRA